MTSEELTAAKAEIEQLKKDVNLNENPTYAVGLYNGLVLAQKQLGVKANFMNINNIKGDK